ncbi:hypothetical protein BOX15_Mlig018598g1 [Macrostomum lignano]|uniref:Uncharacterized protein n=1 Tax=Macrostomum lignano TaxID=282301 RepID=A0A267FP28_9PLAT|nr:hypothetical protein BOX15_Mlig018598g1 [Macrostomum lignano]
MQQPAEQLHLIDCHAHLADACFLEDIDTVVQKAIKNGVQQAIVVSESIENFDRIFELQSRHPSFIQPCLGVHPVQQAGGPGLLVGGESRNRCVQLDDLEKAMPAIEAAADRLIGVGEVGLDFTPRWCPDEAARETQKAVLRRQAEFALRHDLTLNVHSRSAGHHCIELLHSLGVRRAHLHAFNGRPHYAVTGAQLGYYFSIPPEVVRDSGKQRLVAALPLDRLLLETDSPVLGPTVDQRNEPSNARLVLEFIAKDKAISTEAAAAALLDNTMKAYPRLARAQGVPVGDSGCD